MDFDNRKVYGDTSITDGLVKTLWTDVSETSWADVFETSWADDVSLCWLWISEN